MAGAPSPHGISPRGLRRHSARPPDLEPTWPRCGAEIGPCGIRRRCKLSRDWITMSPEPPDALLRHPSPRSCGSTTSWPRVVGPTPSTCATAPDARRAGGVHRGAWSCVREWRWRRRRVVDRPEVSSWRVPRRDRLVHNLRGPVTTFGDSPIPWNNLSTSVCCPSACRDAQRGLGAATMFGRSLATVSAEMSLELLIASSQWAGDVKSSGPRRPRRRDDYRLPRTSRCRRGGRTSAAAMPLVAHSEAAKPLARRTASPPRGGLLVT
jgi:hypothetical protein